MHPRCFWALVVVTLGACGDDAPVEGADAAADGSGDSGDVTDDSAADAADGDTEDTAETGPDDGDSSTDADVDPTDVTDADDSGGSGDTLLDAEDAADSIDAAADAPDADPVELFEVDVCAMTEASSRSGAAWIAVGTGTRDGAYVPLAEPASMVIGQGFQGGYHLWGGFEGSGFEGASIDTNWCAFDTTTDMTIGQAYLTNALVPFEDRQAAGGLTVFLDFSIDPLTLAEHSVRVCVAAMSSSGTVISDCQVVTTSCCDYIDGTGGP